MKRPIEERAWYSGGWSEPLPPTPPDAQHLRGPHAARAPTDEATRRHVGVVLGRFRPPHLGHLHLVSEAFARCGLLAVLTPRAAASSGHLVTLQGAFGDYADVMAVDPAPTIDPTNPTFALEWAARIRRAVPNVTRLFSSDPRGAAAVAAALGVEHILVDPDRRTYPIAARQVRADLYGQFGQVAPGARQHLAVIVHIVGVESAGKTTLANELARVLGAPVVPDELRRCAVQAGAVPSFSDFAHAIRATDDALRAACAADERGVVLVDGGVRLARLWAQRLGHTLAPVTHEIVWRARSDLWLLCEDEFGFQGPPERDEPAARAAFKSALQATLAGVIRPDEVVTIAGPLEARLQTALGAISAVRARKQAALAATPG